MITIASVVTLSMYLLTGPGTFHCVYVKHYTHCNIISLLVKLYFPTLDLNTLLSSLPGHSVTHRFNIHLSFVIKKKINLQGGWQASTAADKAKLFFGTLQAAEVPPVLYPRLCSVYEKLLAYHSHWLFT